MHAVPLVIAALSSQPLHFNCNPERLERLSFFGQRLASLQPPDNVDPPTNLALSLPALEVELHASRQGAEGGGVAVHSSASRGAAGERGPEGEAPPPPLCVSARSVSVAMRAPPSQRLAANHDLYLAVAINRDAGQLAPDLSGNVPGQLIAMQPVERGRNAFAPAPV